MRVIYLNILLLWKVMIKSEDWIEGCASVQVSFIIENGLYLLVMTVEEDKQKECFKKLVCV